MKVAMCTLLVLVASLVAVMEAKDACYPENRREDCHIGAGATEEVCHSRGCLWCPTRQGVPWCYFPQKDKCLPNNQREDCHPGAGATEQKCHERGCLWCPTVIGVPWCYHAK
ncbi:skin secretory protein xP2 [Folsomia candida]|nr:skin secretory protein xP2 [Folsomia candida]